MNFPHKGPLRGRSFQSEEMILPKKLMHVDQKMFAIWAMLAFHGIQINFHAWINQCFDEFY
jgi:hypothetical protein